MAGNIKTLKSNTQVNVLKTSKEQGVKIKSLCKIGVCGRCKIKVIKGNLSDPTPREIKKLGEKLIKEGYRLACQVQFSGQLKYED